MMVKTTKVIKSTILIIVMTNLISGCGSKEYQEIFTPALSPSPTFTPQPSNTATPTLNPYTGPVKIYGHVMGKDGEPLEVDVTFEGYSLGDLGFVTTDINGYYEKVVQDASQYIVSVRPQLNMQVGKFTFPTGLLSQRKLVFKNGPEIRLDFTIGDAGTLWLQAYNPFGGDMAVQDFVAYDKVGAFPTGEFPYGESIQEQYGGWPLIFGSIQYSNRNTANLLLPSGEPADIWMVWRIPEVGTTFLQADNNGRGFIVNKGDLLPVNLVYEFARTEFRKVSTQYQELQVESYSFSNDIQNYLALALQNWNQAENYHLGGSENTSAVYAYKVLTNVVKARELMAVEKAQQNIEKYRKGNLTLYLFDDHGNKLNNATIDYQQINHDFVFSVGWPDAHQLETLREAGIENSFFEAWWGEVEIEDGEYNYPDAVLDHQEDAGISYIMKTGLWLSPAYSPAIPAFATLMSPDELSTQAFQYNHDYVNHFKDRIRWYSAYSEPELPQAYQYTLDEFVDIVQSSNDGVISADPGIPTYIMIAHPVFKSLLMGNVNYTISYDQFGNVIPGKFTHESPAHSGYEFFEALNKAGVDYDMVGLEYAFGAPYPSIDLGIFDYSINFYRTLSKKIFIDEILYPTMEEYPNVNKWWESFGGWHEGYTDKTQADWLTSTLTIAFGNPDVAGYQWGNTNDGPENYYLNGTGLFHKDRVTPRPSLEAMSELIKSWTTNGTSTTNENGAFTISGFGGDYLLSIMTQDGNTYHAQVHVTEQQNVEMDLIVDTTPPVINSISINPQLIMNGDQVEITAMAGESGLSVTADVSLLDSTKVGPIEMDETSEGMYTGVFNISPANTFPNGRVILTISASDEGSNTAVKTIEVSLSNPAPKLDQNPPDDDFTGSQINQSKWSPWIVGGGLIRQNDRIAFTTDGTKANVNVILNSAWQLTGDFDIQVDFQIGEGWSAPDSEHIDGATFGVNIDGVSYHITRLRRVSGGNDDVLFAWSSSGVLSGEVLSHALSGKYRLVRNGTILYLLVDLGDGWKEFASVSVPSSYASVYMANGCIGTYKTFTTYFDNFRINSGLTTYRQ